MRSNAKSRAAGKQKKKILKAPWLRVKSSKGNTRLPSIIFLSGFLIEIMEIHTAQIKGRQNLILQIQEHQPHAAFRHFRRCSGGEFDLRPFFLDGNCREADIAISNLTGNCCRRIASDPEGQLVFPVGQERQRQGGFMPVSLRGRGKTQNAAKRRITVFLQDGETVVAGAPVPIPESGVHRETGNQTTR